MSATTKLSIVLPTEQVRAIQALVLSGQSSGITAFVQHAVGLALEESAAWKALVDESLSQTGGPLTAQEKDWADSVLGISKKQPRKRKAA